MASAYDFSVGGIYYNITSNTDKTVAVSYKGNNSYSVSESYSGDVVIPKSVVYNNTTYTVTSIGPNAFEDCSQLTSVTIPDGVTSIGNEAFYACPNLISITIPNSVTCIGNSAFEYCEGLTSITLSDNLISIGSYAFYYCHGLASIKIPDSVQSIGYAAFGECEGLMSFTIPKNVENIEGTILAGCSNLESIVVEEGNIAYDSRSSCNAIIETSSNTLVSGCHKTIIPENVSSIGNGAFNGFTGLTSITLPDNIISIGSYAFSGCTGLTSITIPNNVTSIGDGAFSGCTALASITMPDNITSIGGNAFNKTLWMNNQPNGMIYVGMVAYSYKGTMPANTSIELKPGTTAIAGSAFADYTGLASITIPEGVTSIGANAFGGCTNLSSVTIPQSVSFIGGNAFQNCSSLTSFSIPASVTTITGQTFAGCKALTSVFIPEGVSTIGYGAFAMSGIKSVTIPNSVTSIESSAFLRCLSLSSVEIGSGITSIGSQPFSGCTNLTDVTINSDSIAAKAYTEKSTLSGIFGSQVTHYTFGDSVTSIGDYACYNLTGLKTVSFGENVKNVGYKAFDGCTCLTKAEYASLRSACSIDYGSYGTPLKYANLFIDGSAVVDIVIPEAATSLGINAFAGYTNLNSVSIPEGVKSISNSAFSGCMNLTSVSLPNTLTSIGASAFYNCTGLTSIAIPESVTSIGSGAFRGCTGLTEVSIPEGITAIEPYTFSGCEGLTSVTIPESVTLIDRGAFNDCIGLTSVVIPEKVDSIGVEGYAITDWSSYSYYVPGAFDGCTNLTDVTINSNSIASKTYTSKTTLAKVFGTQVTHYTFGGAVRTIGDYACYGFEALDSISLGKNMRSIGEFAFAGCENITSVSIPEGVKTIGTGAFSSCSKLIKAEFASLESFFGIDFKYGYGNHCANPLYHASLYINGEAVTDIVVPETVTSIRNNAFCNYKELRSIKMGNNVESIGDYAFASCYKLDSVVIGNNVKSIGQYAFINCSRIPSITIGKNVSTIYYNSFSGCSGLKDVTINSDSIASRTYTSSSTLSNIFGKQVTHYTFGGGVRTIGDYACYNLENLKAVTIGDSVKAVSGYAFGSSGLEKAEFASIESLCGIDFANNYSNPLNYAGHLYINGEEVTEVVIPETVKSIGKCAFIGGKELTSIVIPETVESIGNGALYGCSNLTSIAIPQSVVSIGQLAFYNCTGLTSISISDGVSIIGENAFRGCTGLTSAYIGSNVASIGNTPFNGCTALTDVTINSNTIASKAYSSSSNLSSVFGKQVTHYTFGDAVTAIGDYACYNLTGLKSVAFGDSIASLSQYAFSGCTGLTSIDLPDNMTSIGRRAFNGCTGLTSIDIPDNVTSIDGFAFGGCTGLTEITIGKQMNYISNAAFDGCTRLASVTINSDNIASKNDTKAYSESYTLANMFGDQVTSYTFGDGVQTIGAYACNNLSNLTSVKLAESVLNIGDNAFNGCTGLTKAEYANIESVCNMRYEHSSSSPLYNAHHLFINGEEVTEVAIPETVSTIEWCAFAGCTELTSVTIPNHVTKIDGFAFDGCSSLSTAEIPNSVKYLGRGAFAECENLKTVSLSENLDSIAYGTFYGCSSLTSIIIPDKVHSIGQQAFQLCRSLTNISIPDSVSFIDYGAFANSGLTSVCIPKGVKSLGAAVFFNCPNLKTLVVYPDGLSISSSIFAYCSSLNEIVSAGRLDMTVPDNSTVLVPSALVADMQAKYQNATVLALETTNATQTTLSLSSATDNFKVLGATMDGAEVQVNEGVVKLTGCSPANSYTVNVAGEAFGLPVSIPLAVMTEGLSLAITAKDATNTTLTVQGSYDAGDANVTFAGFDGYEAGNEATVTGLKPGEATSFTYRVKTDDGSEFTITQDVATKPVTIAGETISKTATSVVLKGTLEDLIDVEVESMGFEDNEYQSDELILTGLTPNTTYSKHFKVTFADGGEVEADIEFTTEELTLTTQLPKVVSEGNVILTALSNLDDSETNVGFEWRRQDWSDDFNSKFADAHLFGGTMEGYISDMNTRFLWKYRPYYTAADGTTYYGDWKGIDPTDFSHFDPTVHTYATYNVDGNSVVVNGYAQRGSDNIVRQGFKYWKGTGEMPVDAMTVEANGTVMTATLTGLSTETTYSYVAFVTTSEGETFYGEQQTFLAGEDDVTIMLLTSDDEASDGVEAIYDLSGRRITKMQRGVNIVRYTDGTTRKVRVK